MMKTASTSLPIFKQMVPCFLRLMWVVLFVMGPYTVNAESFLLKSDSGAKVRATVLSDFDQPWAMTFLSDRQLLVTEKPGKLWLLTFSDRLTESLSHSSGKRVVAAKTQVSGLPRIVAGGQGGLGDVVLHPDFDENRLVYISYVERSGVNSGAVVARGELIEVDANTVRIDRLMVVWRQFPKVTGRGHYGHRIAFSPDGYLFITSGERQKFDPAQDLSQNLGKIIRLNDDGSIPSDNPFHSQGGVAKEVWSLGHRNPLGIAFDVKGQLWVHEMGPRGGDELNLIIEGENYGYPVVSNGRHYSGLNIPDHDTRPEFKAPSITWTPVISPSSFTIYSASPFSSWKNSGLIGGLSSQSLIRVSLDPVPVEIERFAVGNRVREVEQGPDGLVYLLEDRSGGRLLQLEPEP